MAWEDIFSEAVKGYAQIEAAKASADGSAGYYYRPETIANQQYAASMSGPYYSSGSGLSSALLIGGGVLLVGLVVVLLVK